MAKRRNIRLEFGRTVDRVRCPATNDSMTTVSVVGQKMLDVKDSTVRQFAIMMASAKIAIRSDRSVN
jgi:hypothetical protein